MSSPATWSRALPTAAGACSGRSRASAPSSRAVRHGGYSAERGRRRGVPYGGLRVGEPQFDDAIAAFRELEEPYWLAVSQLEHAEWLATQGRIADAAPLVVEARSTFERLQVPPMLERVARLDDLEKADAVVPG